MSKFDANMGGTEIYEPIASIFKQEADPTLPRHIYLLTDGAVGNTKQIVDLIRENRANSRVHTFGIGSGASTELIKEGAKAGLGHFSFIYDMNEIEKKVMESLQKDFLEYLSIESGEILDETGNKIMDLPPNLSFATGDKFHLLELLPADLPDSRSL